jgi:hypothetical protein
MGESKHIILKSFCEAGDVEKSLTEIADLIRNSKANVSTDAQLVQMVLGNETVFDQKYLDLKNVLFSLERMKKGAQYCKTILQNPLQLDSSDVFKDEVRGGTLLFMTYMSQDLLSLSKSQYKSLFDQATCIRLPDVRDRSLFLGAHGQETIQFTGQWKNICS